MIEFFNEIANLANVNTLTRKRLIPIDYDEKQYDITVWLKRAAKPDEHAGTNEDGFRWEVVHHGIKRSQNPKPF